MRIDINCDMGEGFGAYQWGRDADLMRFITSANVACGVHAGDPGTMRETVRLAVEYGVAIGAHPGYPDKEGFGRRAMGLSDEELYETVVYQIGALSAFAWATGARLSHVKPHGAMYHRAAADEAAADAVARAVRDVDDTLVLFGPPGSRLIAAGGACGLRTAVEGFADRAYQADGSLTARHHPQALLDQPMRAVAQVLSMVQEGKVTSLDGEDVALRVDTVCVHGDAAGAVDCARAIHTALREAGVILRAP